MCNGRIHCHIHTDAHIGSHHLLSTIFFLFQLHLSLLNCKVTLMLLPITSTERINDWIRYDRLQK